MKGLSLKYAAICEQYTDALNEQWDTDGYWIGEDYQAFDVADCILSNSEMRLCVDRKVDFDTFYEWYCYNSQISYGKDLGKKEAMRINLYNWLKGLPEDQKVPEEIRQQWTNEFWDNL